MASKGGPDISENGMVLYLDASNTRSYPGSGTTWTDLSGNNYDGTLTNGPTFNSGNGGSIVFNASTQYVDTANTSGLNFTNTSATVSVWIKTSASFPSGAYIVAKQMDATGGWSIDLASTGIPYFETKNNASGATACYRFATVVCNNGVWHNVVATFTTSTSVVANNTITMYVDGVSSNSTLNQLLTYGGNTSENIKIGRRTVSSVDAYNGNISNVQIYNRLLSANEVLQNYNATKSRFGL